MYPILLKATGSQGKTSILGVKASEIIYTSGASESNNLAIKGICLKYQNRGKHIITTELEHSSVMFVSCIVYVFLKRLIYTLKK